MDEVRTPRPARATEVKAYSNAGRVELFHNGTSCGLATGQNRIFVWPIQLADGENRIVVRAHAAGGELTDECVWTLAEKKSP